MQYALGELRTRSFQVLLVAFFLLTAVLFSYFFSTLENWKNKTFNTIMLISLGFLSLALFTQFNEFDTPIQAPTWPWPGYDQNHPIWSIFKIIFKGGFFALISYLITNYFGGTNSIKLSAAALGFVLGLLLNFKQSTQLLRYKMSSYISILLKLSLVIAVILGLIWLIQNYSILSTSLSVIFVLILIGFVLFTVYNFLQNNSSFRKFIRIHTIPRMIYYLIFIIPCIVSMLFEGLLTEFGRTPRYVYMILLVESVVLSLYFLIPLFIRWLYLKRPLGSLLGRKSDIDTRLNTLFNSVNKQQQKINKLKGAIPGITWNEIWIPKGGISVSGEQRQVMRDKLSALGYKDDGNQNCPPRVDNTYYDRFKSSIGLVPRCSLGSATEYIIKTQPILLEEQMKYEKLFDTYTDLKYEKDNFLSIFNTKQLINRPVPTDKLLTNKKWHYVNLKKGKSYNYVYSLSSWIFIHQGASNTKFKNNLYASLINYGDKPNISYKSDTKTLRITVQTGTNPEKTIYKTKSFPLQKWNNIVINFDGGTLDVFINNKLVATEKNIIPYISTDMITIGEKEGVSGGICNVVYYPDTLGQIKMDMFYNTLKLKNPPVI